MTFEPHEVNGQPGAIFRDRDGKVLHTLALDVLDGQIQTIRSVINPDKLGHVGPVADAWAIDRTAAWPAALALPHVSGPLFFGPGFRRAPPPPPAGANHARSISRSRAAPGRSFFRAAKMMSAPEMIPAKNGDGTRRTPPNTHHVARPQPIPAGTATPEVSERRDGGHVEPPEPSVGLDEDGHPQLIVAVRSLNPAEMHHGVHGLVRQLACGLHVELVDRFEGHALVVWAAGSVADVAGQAVAERGNPRTDAR